MDEPDRIAPRLALEESAGYDRATIDYIQRAAAHGLYEIRGLGAKRRVPHFDDLLFLAASLSRYPLEGYRERCDTTTVLGFDEVRAALTAARTLVLETEPLTGSDLMMREAKWFSCNGLC